MTFRRLGTIEHNDAVFTFTVDDGATYHNLYFSVAGDDRVLMTNTHFPPELGVYTDEGRKLVEPYVLFWTTSYVVKFADVTVLRLKSRCYFEVSGYKSCGMIASDDDDEE